MKRYSKYRAVADRFVSVLIPVYNTAEFLDETLDSLLTQTHERFEVILIDDGSTDRTPEICRRFAALDERIRFFPRAANEGLVRCLNFGLTHCQGEFIARADGDDVYYPHRLSEQLLDIQAGPYLAVGCAHAVIDQTGAFKRFGGGHNAPEVLERVPAREHYLVHPFLLARAEALRAVGGYRRVTHSEDADLYFRLSERGPIHNTTKLLGHYRIHANSVSGRSVANGRVQVFASQLAAFSASKRRQGAPDIENWEEIEAALRANSESFERMFAAALPRIEASPAQTRLLRWQTLAKFLEMERIRPYQMTPDDAALVAREVRAALGEQDLPLEDRMRLLRYWGRALLSKLGVGSLASRWRMARSLLDPVVAATALYRLARAKIENPGFKI